MTNKERIDKDAPQIDKEPIRAHGPIGILYTIYYILSREMVIKEMASPNPRPTPEKLVSGSGSYPRGVIGPKYRK